MKKRLAIILLVTALTLVVPTTSFAKDISTVSSSGQIEATEDLTRSVSNSQVSVSRLSNTSGSVSAYASFSGTASKAVCTIYLQEKYNGSWRTATGLGTTSYTKTASNCRSITAGKTFTLIKGKVYRAKCVFNCTINGTVYSKTHYSGSF